MTPILMRLYAALLYTYPRDFRLRYGREMQLLFHDQCRDALKAADPFRIVHLILNSTVDWMLTSVRERFAVIRKPAHRGYVSEWIVTILMYLFAATTMVQAYVIPTGSMEGTLRVGDHMLVDRTAYANPGSLGRYVLPYRDVQRGDIIALLYPENTDQTYVKRVIGLPGDHIRMIDKQVIRNGRSLIEPYVRHIDPSLDTYRDDFPSTPSTLTTPRGRDMFVHHVFNGEVVVPPGMLFVMGDNRDNSADGRYWGFVPRDYVAGKPLFVYWSYDAPTEDLETWNIHHLVDVGEHFFARTRWNRTFLVPRPQQPQDRGPR